MIKIIKKFKKLPTWITYILFYIASFSWGIVMTAIGLIVALLMLITGNRPYRFGCCFYFKIGENWGGVNLGPVILIGEDSEISSTLLHESGHAIQNCVLGPLHPFLVAIPSAIRYWYRTFSSRLQPPYDSIWFEGTATKYGYAGLGHCVVKWIERKALRKNKSKKNKS